MANDLTTVKERIDQATSILVTLPENPGKDVVAASLALYLSLKAYNKDVAIVASSAPVVRDSHLVGLDKITSQVGGKNLVITVNREEDAVDKVTSNTEGGHLNLVMIPKTGSAPLKAEDISFSYTGAAADLIIVVGCGSQEEIGALAEREVELFHSATIVSLGNKNSTFGAVNLNDESSSNSELITAMLQELHLPLDADIASNLMQGIEDGTGNLTSPTMTADTFEALAVLYRQGARRSAPVSHVEAKVVSDVPIIEESPADWSKPKIMST